MKVLKFPAKYGTMIKTRREMEGLYMDHQYQFSTLREKDMEFLCMKEIGSITRMENVGRAKADARA
jgi:hypothetical protein